ncbi:MAG: M48 family metalloprotease [Nitrospirales bacterium]|nr:M48 family metalloprotease [Nitrospira sp.]MDR4502927.1 M48 family metalloprotease [Nitrospirales bacterium]
MTDSLKIRIVIITLLGLPGMGCAGGDLHPFGSREQPALNLLDDEQRIWRLSQEEQVRLDRSDQVYDNEVITTYVNQVADHVMPESLRTAGLQVQVRILRNPLLNAFAFPHGVIYLHTGILARMENEAQLATLLGHEMTHASHRHAIQNMRTIKTTSNTLGTVSVVLVPFGPLGGLAMVLGNIGGMAAVTGYSRSFEAEADRVGLELVVAAGYDPHESPKLFEHLKQDLEEQDLDEPFFFGTHPRLTDRIEQYQESLEERFSNTSGETHQEIFLSMMQPVFLENAKLDLATGRFISAEAGFKRYLSRQPDDARGHYWLGEVYRQRGDEGDEAMAVQSLTKAIEVSPVLADPHRSLGIIHMKRQEWSQAENQFHRYLELSPTAPDREFIQSYVEQLQQHH